jgi:hypothetical protein
MNKLGKDAANLKKVQGRKSYLLIAGFYLQNEEAMGKAFNG